MANNTKRKLDPRERGERCVRAAVGNVIAELAGLFEEAKAAQGQK